MATAPGGKKRDYTAADFQRLLSLLDQDPIKAEVRYNGMRERLEWLFERHEGTRAEAARNADETIDRLILQLRRDESFRPANIFSYAAGIARKVVLESYRLPRFASSPDELGERGGSQDVSESEQQMIWLEHCLDRLSGEDRTLIIDYYAREGRAKVDWRQSAAADLNKSNGALRIAVFRIRKRLQKCIEERRRVDGV